MKPVVIDFLPASTPPKGWRWAIGVVGAALVVGSFLLAWRTWQWRQWEQKASALQALVQVEMAQNTPQDTRPVTKPTGTALPAYTGDAWIAWHESQGATAIALSNMEHTRTIGVQPISIDLDARADTVEVQIEFKSRDVLFDYLSALNRAALTPPSQAPSSPESTPNHLPWKLLQAKPATADNPVGTATVIFKVQETSPSAP